MFFTVWSTRVRIGEPRPPPGRPGGTQTDGKGPPQARPYAGRLDPARAPKGPKCAAAEPRLGADFGRRDILAQHPEKKPCVLEKGTYFLVIA